MKTHTLDGTTLEGGGQLVRLSLCLSALTRQPLHLYNIRGNRGGGGGLKGQHLACASWLAEACDADVQGLVLKAKELKFEPRRRGGRCGGSWKPEVIYVRGQEVRVHATRIALETPGAVTLTLQAILPFLLFAGCELDEKDKSPIVRGKSTKIDIQKQMEELNISPSISAASSSSSDPSPILVTLVGGTNVSNSPSIDYISQVLLPNYEVLGLPTVEVLADHSDPKWRTKRGWSSSGWAELGSVTFLVRPLRAGTTLAAFEVPPRGSVTKICVTLLAPRDLLPTMKTDALSVIRKALARMQNLGQQEAPEIEVVNAEESGDPKRVHVLLVAKTANGLRLGADCLGSEKSGRSFKARLEVAERLICHAVRTLVHELESGLAVDRWMEDQLVVFRALAAGKSTISSKSSMGSPTLEGIDTERCDERTENNKPEIRPSSASLHTLTARWVANELLGVQFDELGNTMGVGYIAGVGFEKQ